MCCRQARARFPPAEPNACILPCRRYRALPRQGCSPAQAGPPPLAGLFAWNRTSVLLLEPGFGFWRRLELELRSAQLQSVAQFIHVAITVIVQRDIRRNIEGRARQLRRERAFRI